MPSSASRMQQASYARSIRLGGAGYTHACRHTYTHIKRHVHTNTNTMYTHTHTEIHIHTLHTYKYTHTQRYTHTFKDAMHRASPCVFSYPNGLEPSNLGLFHK